MSIITEYPIWFILFCLLAGLAYSFFLYRKINPEITKVIRYTLFVSRFLVVSLLCFFLLNPLIKSTSSFTEKPIIVIAADNSASIIKSKDSLFYKNEFSSQIHKLSEALAEKYEIHFLKFSNEVKEDSSLDYADRKSTRLNSSHIQKSRMPSSA